METLVEGLGFAEGPRWHDGRLVFSDIKLQRVHALSLGGELETLLEHDGRPSGLGWQPSGSMLVVSMLDQTLMREERGMLRPFADLGPYCHGSAANDMVVDAQGRAYVGNMGFDYEKGEEPCTTQLARVDLDGTTHMAADELWGPNGMAISPDGRTLVVAESAAMRLTAFDIAEDASLSGRRVFAELPPAAEGTAVGATPDGICLDAEGAVWLASPTTREFLRVREGGEVVDSVRVPSKAGGEDRIAIACVLGGDDRRTLVLLSSDTMSIDHAEAGSAQIDAHRVEVAGAGVP